MTFIEVGICRRMGPLEMLFVLRDLDLHFQGQSFKVAILTSKRWKVQTLLLPSDRKSGVCHRMKPLQMLYIMTLTYIIKVTNFEMSIYRKR